MERPYLELKSSSMVLFDLVKADCMSMGSLNCVMESTHDIVNFGVRIMGGSTGNV